MRVSGRLFVFEGCDESGKTTLTKALCEVLTRQNHATRCFAFPGRVDGTLERDVHRLHHDPKSANIEQIHPASLQILHIAAHIDSITAAILPALKRGEWVVLDRYWWSTWAYGIATGVNRSALKTMIHLELLYWRGVTPTALFLVERKTKRGHGQDMRNSKILDEYYNLAKRERKHFPVHIIKNDEALHV